jgi:hypothetical protein
MSDLKELKLDLEYLLGIPDGVFGDREVIYGDLAEAALAAISTLEAKLAVAREALEDAQSALRGSGEFDLIAKIAQAFQEIEQ